MCNVIFDCAYVFILQYLLNEPEYITSYELVFFRNFLLPCPVLDLCRNFSGG